MNVCAFQHAPKGFEMSEVVAYLRVSTTGRAVGPRHRGAARSHRPFRSAEGLVVASEHVEVENGKGADALDLRPQLRIALDRARKLKCPIVVAKLDRLSPRRSFHQRG